MILNYYKINILIIFDIINCFILVLIFIYYFFIYEYLKYYKMNLIIQNKY